MPALPGLTDDMLTGLGDQLRHLLTSTPRTRKKLLELAMRWDDLGPGNTRMAAGLRVFIISWDPLETRPPRPPAFATANAHPFEIVLYVPLWSLPELAEQSRQAGRDATVAAALGALGGSAVLTAGANEDLVTSGEYPFLAIRDEAPDLLAAAAEPGNVLGMPTEIRAVAGRWDDLGLGATTDIVQQAYGPVDLDRSLVELAPVRQYVASCPACGGKRFGFIADLVESSETMCGPHRNQAVAVRMERFARAENSNVAGWEAIIDCSARLSEPHLPDGLRLRLPDDADLHSAPDELAALAQALIEAAGWFPGRAREFNAAFGEPDNPPEWTRGFLLQLGEAGLVTEAEQVAEALIAVDASARPSVDGDLPLVLAVNGRADEARAKVTENLSRWPHDFWVRIRAGETLQRLEDRDGALGNFRFAQRLALEGKDFRGRDVAALRIRNITGADEVVRPLTERHPRRVKKSRSSRG
jgi:hypothetical protein